MQSDFPFTIEQIALDILHLQVRHRKTLSFDVDCPFCGRQGKMNINRQKDAYRCNYCDAHGGMLELYTSVANKRMDFSSAYWEICSLLNIGDSASFWKPNDIFLEPRKKLPEIQQSELAPIDVRNQTYSYLFSLLTLKPHHSIALERRGLTKEQIDKYGYKSTPVLGFTRLASKVLENGYQVEGVPGFYINDYGEWTLNFKSKCAGFLVPVLDMEGRIQAAQIRLDHPFKKCKYIWLSSSELVMGTGSGSPVHFVGDPHAKTVTFTEGGLKGTIAHCLSGDTLICNAGASQSENIIKLFPILRNNGVEEIQAGYDMDLEQNEQVCHGCLKILSAAKEFGFKARRRKWNDVNKGIDDLAWAKKLSVLLCEKLELTDWPEEIGDEAKKILTNNLSTQPICSDTLIYLYFDNPMSYLVNLSGRYVKKPFHALLEHIEKDRLEQIKKEV